MTGPETDEGEAPEFDSIEERLAFAEIVLAASVSPEAGTDERPPPDDPFAAFPD